MATLTLTRTVSGIVCGVEVTYSVSSTETQTTLSITKVLISAGSSQLLLGTVQDVALSGAVSYSYSTDVTGYKTLTPSKTASWSRGHSASSKTLTLDMTFKVEARSSGEVQGGGAYSNSATITVPARASYTVGYAVGGGSWASGKTYDNTKQTKWYGESLTLQPSSIVTRANATNGSYTVTLNGNGASNPNALSSTRRLSYAFNKWKATSGSLFSSGGSYTTNAATTMTAQWTSTETRDAVTLPSITRTNYTFNGWYTAASGGTSVSSPYTPSGNITLYAHWTQVYATPQLAISRAYRCDSNGDPDDEGTSGAVEVSFKVWNTSGNGVKDDDGLSCTIGSASPVYATSGSGNNKYSLTTSGSWLVGTCKFVVANACSSTQSAYAVSVTLTDKKNGTSGYSIGTVTQASRIGTAFYTMDVKAGGHGICFGGVANKENYVHINLKESFGPYNNSVPTRAAAYDGNNPNVVDNKIIMQGQYWYDRENANIGYAEINKDSSSNMYRSWAVQNTDSSNNDVLTGLYLYANRDGTHSAAMTTGTTWPIANGGTGQTGTTTVSAPGSIISAYDNTITFDGAYYAQWGKLAQVTITFKTSAAKSGSWAMGTIVSGKRPAIYNRGITSSTALITYIIANGTITMYGSLAASTATAVSFTYLLP